MHPLRTVGLILASAALLGGCGSSSDTTGTTGRATTQTPPASVASRSTQAILRDVATALARVRSYHVEGTQTDKDGTSHLTADVSAAGSFRSRIGIRGNTVDMIVVGPQTFLKADRRFWRAQGHTSDAAVRLLAGRWVKVPDRLGTGLHESLDKLLPAHLAACLMRSSGVGVSKQTGRTLSGRPAVVLTDKRRKPGSSPGALWVAATGPTLPLRETQTGPRVPGGHLDAKCEDPKSTTTKGDIRFSRYDKPLHIVAPAHPLDLEALARAGAQTPA